MHVAIVLYIAQSPAPAPSSLPHTHQSAPYRTQTAPLTLVSLWPLRMPLPDVDGDQLAFQPSMLAQTALAHSWRRGGMMLLV